MAYGTLGYGSQAYGAWEYGTRRPVLLEGAPVSIKATPSAPFQRVKDVAGNSGIYLTAGVDMLRLIISLDASTGVSAAASGQAQKVLAGAGSLHIVLSSDAMLETLNRFGGSSVILTTVTGDMQRIAALAAPINVNISTSAGMQRIAPMGATVSIAVALTDAFRIVLYFKPNTVPIVVEASARLITVLPVRGRTHIQLGYVAQLQRLPKLVGSSLITTLPAGRLTGDFRLIGQNVFVQTLTYGALRKEWAPLDYDGTIWTKIGYPVTEWTEVDHGEDTWRPYDHFSQSQ